MSILSGQNDKNGFDERGNQIGCCTDCGKHKAFHRIDYDCAYGIETYIKITLNEIRKCDLPYSERTYERHTKEFRLTKMVLPLIDGVYNEIFLEGIKVADDRYFLIARVRKSIIAFMECERKDYKSLREFLASIKAPLYVIYDCQKELKKATKELGNETKMQRGQFHIIMNVKQKITSNPKTDLGKELKLLTQAIPNAKTVEQVEAGANHLNLLFKHFDFYLKERTYGKNGSWGYTHKRAILAIIY